MADGSYSIFNGYTVTLYAADGTVIGSWPAISGRRGHQQPGLQGLINMGPIPEGKYSFSIDAIQPLDTWNAALGIISDHGTFPAA